MTEKEVEICLNCGVRYNLKKGAPEFCWYCGLPTGEKIDEI